MSIERYSFVRKTHTSNADYSYQTMFNDANEYESFFIDADFNEHGNVHIGFSATDGHDDEKWEILIGGWGGTISAIRSANQSPLHGHVKAVHTQEEFNEFKHNLQVI